MEDEGDEEEKSLYICCMETYPVGSRDYWCYSVQAINLTEIFSYSETPIEISFSRSPPIKRSRVIHGNSNNILREVDSHLEGDSRVMKREVRERYNRVPFGMGCGVFGTQILLAGGIHRPHSRRRASSDVYILDTNPELQLHQRFRFNKESIMKFQSSKMLPKLMVIEGKLYALDLLPRSFMFDQFQLFDPQAQSQKWVSLPEFPEQLMDYVYPLSCSVVGTQIMVSLYPFVSERIDGVYCFDVAVTDSENTWKPILPSYDSTSELGMKDSTYEGPYPDLPFTNGVTLESDDDGELVISYWPDMKFGPMRFFHIDRKLSEHQELVIKYVAAIEVDPKFDLVVSTTNFIHLGGRKVCCVLFDFFGGDGSMNGVFVTFEYSFSKIKPIRSLIARFEQGSKKSSTSQESPAAGNYCTDDPYIRISYPSDPNGKSFEFSAKTLGWRPFKYCWDSGIPNPLEFEVLGLAVLPLHQQEHAYENGNEEDAIESEYASYANDSGKEGSSSDEEEFIELEEMWSSNLEII